MGIRSDVAVVLTNQLYKEVKENDVVKQLFSYADHLEVDEEQTLIVLESVKFNRMQGNEFSVLLDLIEDKKDSYYILEVCSEYTQVNEFGELESHFDLGYSMVLTY